MDKIAEQTGLGAGIEGQQVPGPYCLSVLISPLSGWIKCSVIFPQMNSRNKDHKCIHGNGPQPLLSWDTFEAPQRSGADKRQHGFLF
jgi:hypothetical protein